MKYLVLVGRLIFGGWFLVNGLNHWFAFFPQPMGTSALGNELVKALIDSHLFDVVKAIEAVAGAFILIGRLAPLALMATLPLSVVIFYWNVVLERTPIESAFGIATLALNGLLMFAYLDAYRPMLAWRTRLLGEKT